MRTKLVITAILIQCLILGWMAAEREWIVRTGPSVWLRTAPVDPRDLFRGDYVTLGYEISNIPAGKFGPALKQYMAGLANRKADSPYRDGREIVIYATLEVQPGAGVAEMVTADLTPPPAGLFIKGRVRPFWNAGRSNALIGVAYGIDAYYVQQGKGRELERRAPEGMPPGIQVPMEMEVALGRNGTAVLKAHRWNALGIGVQIQNETGPDTAPPPATPNKKARKTIRVTLCNPGTAPLAVVLPPDLRTLRIQRVQNWRAPGEDAGVTRDNLPPLTDADVRLLQPGESATADLDPARDEWFVSTGPDATPRPLGHMGNDYQGFRIVYEPPAAAACQGLKEAARVIPGALPSRQFSSYELRDP